MNPLRTSMTVSDLKKLLQGRIECREGEIVCQDKISGDSVAKSKQPSKFNYQPSSVTPIEMIETDNDVASPRDVASAANILASMKRKNLNDC